MEMVSTGAEQIGPAGERLQRQWLALLREHFEHFELCEFYAFWCMAGSGKRIPMANSLAIINKPIFGCF